MILTNERSFFRRWFSQERLRQSLRNLQSTGIVHSTLELPAFFFYVLSPEKAIDLLIKTKVQETQEIQHGKKEMLTLWQIPDYR